jgi:ferric-dicitrate binding protein FerR (iron transport regulator)
MEKYKDIGLHIADYLLNGADGIPADPILAEWLTDDANRIELKKYQKIWEETRTVMKAEQFDKEQAWKKVDAINRHNERFRNRLTRFYHLVAGAAAAAVLLLPTLILTYYLLNKPQNNEEIIPPVELTTAHGEISKFTLPDSSHVWLNANSRLTYTDAFGNDSRDVELSGEAYFEITEDAGKPFIVKAGEVSVCVLGTVFNVQAYSSEKRIETTLLKGLVSVMQENIPKGGIFLHPGQQLLFDKSDKNVIVKEVDITPYTSWKDGKLIFRQTVLKDAFAIMERSFQIKIVVNDKSLENCKLTGRFSLTEKPEDIMGAIKKTLNFEYEKQDNTFIIK